jgi:hypothetical protein
MVYVGVGHIHPLFPNESNGLTGAGVCGVYESGLSDVLGKNYFYTVCGFASNPK